MRKILRFISNNNTITPARAANKVDRHDANNLILFHINRASSSNNFVQFIIQGNRERKKLFVYISWQAANAFVGTFMGVEFTDSDGRRRVSNKFLANTPATDVTAYITRDPAIVYQIQANGAVNISNIGNQYDFGSITAGSTVIGLSTAVLDTASLVASGAVAQMRVIGITPGPDNAWGDAYTIVQVQISEHQDVATINAY